MDWIIWLVVIVAIVAIVWWLLNRNSSRRGAGSAGTEAPATAPATAPGGHDAGQAASHAEPAPPAEPELKAGREPEPALEPEPVPEPELEPVPERVAAATGTAPSVEDAEEETSRPGTAPAEAQATASVPAHHREYTEPHAPTLPGAESAAAEAGPDAEAAENRTLTPATEAAPAVATSPAAVTPPAATPAAATPPAMAAAAESPTAESHLGADTRHSAMFLADSEPAPRHDAEPGGHLAADQPYGEGSAAPAADGSGPEGFTVKGNASSMVYHDETSPAFEETRAEVWFLSTAHAEAAGFRPPRRTRQ